MRTIKEKVKLACTYCDKPFELPEHKVKRPTKTGGRFCSAHCRAKFINQDRITKTEVNCAQCGKPISLQPYRLLNVENNFCSRSCTTKYQLSKRWADAKEMIAVSCAFCGKEKQILKWDAEQKSKRGQEQFFCDRQCFGGWKSANWAGENNPSWKGGWTPHGTGWNRIRQVVRQEQDYKCLDCGIAEGKLGRELDVHHIIPARFFKRKADASIRSNLVGCCHKCHMKRERSEIPLFKI